MPLTYLDLTEAEIEAFGAQKQRRIHARRARAWKHMAREERDAGAAAPPKPPAATSRRPRYRRGERRKPEEPHPFADPNRPIPNLAAADRFECCSMVIGPVLAVPQLGGATPGRLRRAPVCHRKCALSPMALPLPIQVLLLGAEPRVLAAGVGQDDRHAYAASPNPSSAQL